MATKGQPAAEPALWVITGHGRCVSLLIILQLIPQTHDIYGNAPELYVNSSEEKINVCMETAPKYLCWEGKTNKAVTW